MGRLKMKPAKMPKKRQREDEADHELEQDYLKSHNDPRCLNRGIWRTLLEARIWRVSRAVKRVGEKTELSTTERGSTAGSVFVTAMVGWLLSYLVLPAQTPEPAALPERTDPQFPPLGAR
jgi:hypothetical protein